jgi:hypothetical protein
MVGTVADPTSVASGGADFNIPAFSPRRRLYEPEAIISIGAKPLTCTHHIHTFFAPQMTEQLFIDKILFQFNRFSFQKIRNYLILYINILK